jgi:muconolactone delta-isomerase
VEALTIEHLVTMTTHVPGGTSEEAIDDIRAREAAHSRELAARGHLLRLWRPALKPGEWRSFGLFAAQDGGQLEEVLASMPLRVWRTDEVTPLSPHPDDPALAPGATDKTVEFLTTFTIAVPVGTPAQAAADTEACEAERAHELAGQGHLLRLWALGEGPRAGPVARPGRRRDAGDLEVAAAGCLDDCGDHAAQPAPRRPGAHQDLTTYPKP